MWRRNLECILENLDGVHFEEFIEIWNAFRKFVVHLINLDGVHFEIEKFVVHLKQTRDRIRVAFSICAAH